MPVSITIHEPLPPALQAKSIGTFPFGEGMTKLIIGFAAAGVSEATMAKCFPVGQTRLLPMFYSRNIEAEIIECRPSHTADIDYVISAIVKTTKLVVGVVSVG